MSKVRALNRDGKITWCTFKTPGQRNCNHILHQGARMTDGEFQECVDEYNERMLQKLNSSDENDRVECAKRGYGLNILKNDKSKTVRDIVNNELSKEEKSKSTEQEIDDDFKGSSKHIAIKDSLMVGEIKAHLEEKSKEFDRDLKRLEKEIEKEDSVSIKEDNEDDI